MKDKLLITEVIQYVFMIPKRTGVNNSKKELEFQVMIVAQSITYNYLNSLFVIDAIEVMFLSCG